VTLKTSGHNFAIFLIINLKNVISCTCKVSSVITFEHNNIQQIFTMAFGIRRNLPTLSSYSFNTFNTNTALPTIFVRWNQPGFEFMSIYCLFVWDWFCSSSKICQKTSHYYHHLYVLWV